MEPTVTDNVTGEDTYREDSYNYTNAYDYYDNGTYYNYTGYEYYDYGQDPGLAEVSSPDPLREIGYGGLVPGLNYSSVVNHTAAAGGNSGLYNGTVWNPKDYFFEVVIKKCVHWLILRN